MISRTQVILTVAFGSLIVLIGLSGWAAWRQASDVYARMSAVQQASQSAERHLTEIRADILESGTLVRDFLLDPSHLTAGFYREQLLALRSSMEKDLSALHKISGPDEARQLERLRGEVNAYWDSLDPVFDWSPQQKTALSSGFLRRQVLPRRIAVTTMADEVQDLYEKQRVHQQQAIARSTAEFQRYLLRILAGALSLGILVAAASIARISVLERRAMEHRRRIERAEAELRSLSRQLVETQEEERGRISRELHDEVGQKLTALRLELGNFDRLLSGKDDAARRRLEETKQLSEETMRVVRDLAMGLRPSMLDDLGLGPALEWQAREFSRRTGVPVDLAVEGNLADLPDRQRTCLYRLVQEALTNCARHAQASSVRVTVHRHAGRTALAVRDNGAGFDPTSASPRGLGILGMQERVRELGGSLLVASQPGKGTVLTAEIPVPEGGG